MTIRRLTAAFFALTLPLAVAACGADDETLAEPDLSSAPETSSAAGESTKEETSERPSTTVSTVYETEDEKAAAENGEGDMEAGAKTGSGKGPCDWTPMEEGEPGELISFYCDGSHAGLGTYATDHTEYLYWDGKEWAGLEPSGQTYTGFKCYDKAKVEELGFPDELRQKMIICD